MCWCFATINNKLGEIYFDKVRRGNKLRIIFKSHCYVKKSEFKTKEERQALDIDAAKFHIFYRNGKYNLKKQKKLSAAVI
jgi:hypothetical protein